MCVVCVCVCVYTYICTCAYMRVCICFHIQLTVKRVGSAPQAHELTLLYVCLCVCVCVYVFIYNLQSTEYDKRRRRTNSQFCSPLQGWGEEPSFFFFLMLVLARTHTFVRHSRGRERNLIFTFILFQISHELSLCST